MIYLVPYPSLHRVLLKSVLLLNKLRRTSRALVYLKNYSEGQLRSHRKSTNPNSLPNCGQRGSKGNDRYENSLVFNSFRAKIHEDDLLALILPPKSSAISVFNQAKIPIHYNTLELKTYTAEEQNFCIQKISLRASSLNIWP